ncbi:hypothetical protein E4H04_04700 [Candidatus Bathyarchaeota archaeon]|nr:MAG: hypothetical protein E4H04_04700 [Candidatus Bathyarchaeota archaeon]
MSDIEKQVERLLSSECPVKVLSELMSEIRVSAENRSELEDIENMLEIHENEIRSLRQNLSLRLRQYSFEYYSEYLKKKAKE